MSRKIVKSRRGKNEGCIYQKDNGDWVSMVTLGYDDNGKRVRKAFVGKTRAEVAIKMTSVLNDHLKGGRASLKNDTLQVLMHEWLMTFKRAEVSPRSFERNLRNAEIHIFPQIGELKPSEVTSNIIQGLFIKMLFAGYSLPTVRKIKFLLSQFFTYLKLDNNPVAATKVKSTKEHKEHKKEEYKALPIEARKKFLDAIKKSDILEPICMIQLFGGLRIGEVLALKWKDLGFKNNVINIDNAITQVPEIDRNGKVISRDTVISDTKTCASVREVPMPDILKDSLLRWQKIRLEKQITTGISFTDKNDLVFSNNDGKLRTYSGIRVLFDRLMKQNGLESYHFHFHTLRHTYSSMLFESRENPKVIQMLLGHKDVTTTIRTYNSVDRSYFKQATAKLEEKFKADIPED